MLLMLLQLLRQAAEGKVEAQSHYVTIPTWEHLISSSQRRVMHLGQGLGKFTIFLLHRGQRSSQSLTCACYSWRCRAGNRNGDGWRIVFNYNWN